MNTISKKLPHKVILKNGKIIDTQNKQFLKYDIKIANGTILEIAPNIPVTKDDILFDISGNLISPGLFDAHVHFRDPGVPEAEDIYSGANAAIYGGFTGVGMMPNTNPAIDNVEIFKNLKNKAQDLLLDIHPIPAVTKQRQGNTLTDMESLKSAGALAFTDDGSPLEKSQIMYEAMLKAKELNLPIMVHEEDKTFDIGDMNLSSTSNKINLKGVPSIAEDIMVARDILIAEYTNSHVHFQHISTKRSVEMIRYAKKKGINITAEATPHHFALNDHKLEKKSANYKMMPPLREEKDRLAVCQGLADGTIDIIATDHAPHTEQSKTVNFSKAPNGVIGLESAFSVALKYLVNTKIIDIFTLIEKMSINPRKILNLDHNLIIKQKKANLTIFNLESIINFNKDCLMSKSKNSPFLGEKLQGKITMVINNGLYFSNI